MLKNRTWALAAVLLALSLIMAACPAPIQVDEAKTVVAQSPAATNAPPTATSAATPTTAIEPSPEPATAVPQPTTAEAETAAADEAQEEGPNPLLADPDRPGLTEDGSPTLGDPDAPVVILDFSNFL